MSNNPLLKGRIVQQMSVGIVTRKVQPDHFFISENMKNAEDKAISGGCYPGGSKPINHDFKAGKLVFTTKGVRNEENMVGEPTEVAFASVAGLYADGYSSHRAMEGQFNCVGVSLSDYHFSDPVGGTADAADPDHGLGVITQGTATSENNGPYMLYAGQPWCWRFPPGPKRVIDLEPNDNEFQGGSADYINKRSNIGHSHSRIDPEIVPFDYTDFGELLASSYASMRQKNGNHLEQGIADVPFSKFWERAGVADVHPMSTIQEVAGGNFFGRTLATMTAVEVLIQDGFLQMTAEAKALIAVLKNKAATTAQIEAAKKTLKVTTIDAEKVALAIDVDYLTEAIGTWELEPEKKQTPYKMFANAYLHDVYPDFTVDQLKTTFRAAFMQGNQTAASIIASTTVNNNPRINYKKGRLQLSRFTEGAIAGGYYDKSSRVMGIMMNSCAPTETAFLLLGGTCL